jgi:hypothetical protein
VYGLRVAKYCNSEKYYYQAFQFPFSQPNSDQGDITLVWNHDLCVDSQRTGARGEESFRLNLAIARMIWDTGGIAMWQ